jgi:hypothetical protein
MKSGRRTEGGDRRGRACAPAPIGALRGHRHRGGECVRDLAQAELRLPGAERQNEGNVTNEPNGIRWLAIHKL